MRLKTPLAGSIDRLAQLKPGTPVVLKNGRTEVAKGKIESVTDKMIELRVPHGRTSLARTDAKRFTVVDERTAGFRPFIDLPLSIGGQPIRLVEGQQLKLLVPGSRQSETFTVEAIDLSLRQVTLSAPGTKKVIGDAWAKLELGLGAFLDKEALEVGDAIQVTMKDGSVLRGTAQSYLKETELPEKGAGRKLLLLATRGSSSAYEHPLVSDIDSVQRLVLFEK